ncbi:glycosyl transferase family protein [Andreprevotia chitinilytica]|uniref:glycosyl transferase family protein n=1 Tax=Andreprevotia chitinilytica TaxID=396808 RepID=UPI00068B7865|nr:glycosyl transferase family protein [Andreprevotia chitinilytica]
MDQITAQPWQIYFAHYYSALESFAAVAAVLILISSLDDLFIDAWYWTREIYRKLTVKRANSYKPLTAAQLKARAEQPLAIMVPAWLEYDVIAQMIENMVTVLDYRSYVVFVGTYVNDAATIAEVERMRRRYRQLKRVEVPHPGPTCKADCLNWIIQAIFLHEQENNMEFAGVILHDSEDVLHPMELQFFNYLLPRKDMIQLPVTSLEREWYELVAGTYMDEFAEWHAKDLVVRESVSGMVPSAGVGTCFSRRALKALSDQTNNQPFNTESLTEDYDVGARLAELGMNSIFARFPVQFRALRSSWFGFGRTRELTLDMALCVREYFPDTFRTAYRQKARWVLGIGLQSWEHLGWRGSLATKYLLFRDRKGIITSFVSIFAYLLFFQFMLLYVATLTGVWTMRFPPIFAPGSWLMAVATFTAVALGLRVVQRFYFVTKLYGWEHGLMSIPRMVVGNVINFMAVARAWRMFLAYLLFGKRMVWDKTMHDFPSSSQLAQKRQRLGELLLAWQAVDADKLEAALVDQAQHKAPLGRILLAKGWLDDETLAEAISFQAELPRAQVDAEQLRANAELLPEEYCVRWRTLPIGQSDDGLLQLAVANPLSDEAIEQIRTATGCDIAQHIARESEIGAGLRLLRGSETVFEAIGRPLIGDVLIEHNLISREQFDDALVAYRPDRDGRIGDYLVQRGVVSRASIELAIKEQQARAVAPQLVRFDDEEPLPV